MRNLVAKGYKAPVGIFAMFHRNMATVLCRACLTKQATMYSKDVDGGGSVRICSQLCSDSFWIAERQRKIQGLYQDGFRIVAAAACEKKSADRVSEGACGEDSFFISSESLVLGVADGVGGYHGTSGYFARCIMERLEKYANGFYVGKMENDALEPGYDVGRVLPSIMDQAYKICKQEKSFPPGATTAVLALVDPSNRTLHVCNIGDSGAVVIRDGKVVFMTSAQVHENGAPYQLSNVAGRGDSTAKADQYRWGPLEKGDLIVLASDGIWDNLYPNELMDVIKRNPVDRRFQRGHRDLSDLAQLLVAAALETNRKRDDITLVVGRVYDIESAL